MSEIHTFDKHSLLYIKTTADYCKYILSMVFRIRLDTIMKKIRLVFSVLFLSLIFWCITSCIDEYAYIDAYLGSWEFTVTYYHKIYPAGTETTNTEIFEGVINEGSSNNKVLIQYAESRNLDAEVDENGILNLNCMQPSSCSGKFTDANSFEYRYSARINSSGNMNIYLTTIAGKKISSNSSLNKAPEVISKPATGISVNGALLRGNAIANYLFTTVSFDYGPTSKYGNNVIARQNPISGHTNTDISIYATDLNPGTLYHFRAKSKNSLGTTYGDDMTFTTMEKPEGATDADGNTYPAVQIDDQIWMAQNLRTTKFLNGDPIPTTATIMTDISSETDPVYQWLYDGVESYAATYGRLYTWYAVNDSRKICPSGWHIPSQAELDTLRNRIDQYSGGILKEAGTSHWLAPNEGATNATGFTALPGGSRIVLAKFGVFSDIGGSGNWWSSSTYSPPQQGYFENSAIAYSLINYASIFGMNYSEKNRGMSVRCLRDQ